MQSLLRPMGKGRTLEKFHDIQTDNLNNRGGYPKIDIVSRQTIEEAIKNG